MESLYRPSGGEGGPAKDAKVPLLGQMPPAMARKVPRGGGACACRAAAGVKTGGAVALCIGTQVPRTGYSSALVYALVHLATWVPTLRPYVV